MAIHPTKIFQLFQRYPWPITLMPWIVGSAICCHFTNSSSGHPPLVFYAVFCTGFALLPIAAINKTLAVSITASSIIFLAVYTAYIVNYHSPPNEYTVFAILETNISETTDFFSTGLTYAVGATLALLLPSVYLFTRVQSWNFRINNIFIALTAASALFAPIFISNELRSAFRTFNPAVVFLRGFREYRLNINRQTLIAERYEKELAQSKSEPTDTREKRETHVIILGESATKWHWGLYGYPRETNPQLSKMRDLLVFSDVVSPFSHTARSIPAIFFQATSPSAGLENASISLIHELRKNNYTTHWVSNQNPIGLYDNCAAVIARFCDSAIFNTSTTRYDGELIKYAKKIISNSKGRSVIILHLMGSHQTYRNRYPLEFSHFSTSGNEAKSDRQTTIDNYDDSIRYSDEVISALIEYLKSNCETSSLIYLSDHGEDVFDVGATAGHTEQYGTRPMFEIPFVTWASESFIKRLKQKGCPWEETTKKAFITSNFTSTYLNLLGISVNEDLEKRSLFSKCYSEETRVIKGDNYLPEKMPTSQREILTSFKNRINKIYANKIWVHRVNSVNHLREVKGLFGGVEMDCIYEGTADTIEVNHPPAVSINLDLATMLSELKTSNDGAWLDFKNTSSSLADKAANRLKKILANTEIHTSRIIVESPMCDFLAAFSRQGFTTALSVSKENNNISYGDWKTINESMINHATPYNFISISFSDLKNLGTNCNINNGILTWNLINNSETNDEIQEAEDFLSKNPNIKVILIKIPSIHER